jgi:hypothetical protein
MDAICNYHFTLIIESVLYITFRFIAVVKSSLYSNICAMFELNGEIFYKVFEVGKIPSYMDPAKKYSEDYIYQVAKNYDPVNIHEAPFWVGHPDWRQEPRAGGWIKKIVAMGKELYVSFSDITEWMKELYNSGEFKKCSVEMGDLEVDSNGTVIPYLWALGATNIPAVKGLPVLKFTDTKFDQDKLKNKVSFSLLNFDYNLPTINNNTEMESLKKIAASLGITITGKETEAELTQAIEDKTVQLKASEASAAEALRSASEANAVKLVDDAIAAGKIAPAQKEEFLPFAKSNFDGAVKLFASMQAKNLTSESGVAKGADKTGATDEFAKVAYEDILKDPDKYVGKLTDAQFEDLSKKSPVFGALGV